MKTYFSDSVLCWWFLSQCCDANWRQL